MKKLCLTLTSVSLLLSLVACSSGETAPESVSNTESVSQSGESTSQSGETATDTRETDGAATGNNRTQGGATRGDMELPEGFAEMSSEEKMAYMSEMGVEMPDMSQREGMERPEGMTGGGMGAMNLPEGMEFPEGFETMSSEEKMAAMAEMGIEIPDMSEKEALRGEEGVTRPNMAQGQNEQNGQNTENPPTEAPQTPLVEGESLVGEVVSISDNTFELILTDGSAKTIVIPKELNVANGDYTRILEGMNLTFQEGEDGAILSVAITK